MKTKLFAYFEMLRASFWFKPSFMALAAVALSFLTVALDRVFTNAWLRSVDWIYGGGAEGASAVLQAISSSMINIAGVVFSLTLVALSLASSQFGSRLLRNFMRDATNQLVLGTFIATFLYCLLVLRTIRREEEGQGAFVPHLSVTLGLVFALASLWMLIYFIHHVSVSIQAEEVIARVGEDLDQATDRLFPENSETDPARPEETDGTHLQEAFAHEAVTIPARGDGYLQFVDLDRLMKLATQEDLILRLERRPGHYLVERSSMATVWPGSQLTPEILAEVQSAFVLGNQRSLAQDVEFAILQLVEIAVRALSPGINDPFTTIACVDRLGSALSRLAQRTFPLTHRIDDQGRVRIIVVVTDFTGFADTALNQLRQYARNNVDVTLRLLETIVVVARVAHREADVAALRRHADMIVRSADGFPELEDQRAVAARYQAALLALHRPA